VVAATVQPRAAAAAGGDAQVLWQRAVPGYGLALAVDPAGNAAVLTGTDGVSGGPRLLQFAPDGRRRWQRVPVDGARVAVADAGGVTLGTNDGRLARYDRTGRLGWVRPVAGIDWVETLAHTPAGALLMTSVAFDRDGYAFGLLLECDAGGGVLWRKAIRPTPDAYTNDLAVGPMGHVAAIRRDGLSRYAPAGSRRWEREPGFPEPYGAAIAVDRAGGVIAAGRSGYGPAQVAWVVRFDAGGTPLWRAGIEPQDWPASGRAEAVAVAADPAGVVWVAGNSTGPLKGEPPAAAVDQDVWLAKFAPNGVALWQRRFARPGTQAVVDLALDGDGNLLLFTNADAAAGGAVLYRLRSRPAAP
jgi:hypothetical protein